MPPKPVVLKKSVAGLIYIYTSGLILAAAILVMMRLALVTQPQDTGIIGASALAVLMLDILGMFVFAYTYKLSKVIITRSHITVYNYPSPFAP